jgi:uncharacterized membrane protein
MSTQSEARETAPRRYTSAALTGGVLVAAVCFVVAIAAELVGIEAGSGEMTDIAAVIDGLLLFTPWAWATLGAYAVVATPALGLIVTGWEYSTISDRRTVLLAAAVLVVLASSATIAVLR